MRKPFVTVILPVRNEAAYIERSLGAVLAQDFPAEEIEVLVADGASEDATVATILSLPAAGRVRIIANPARIQAAGMNAALREARGEIIIRVDGHTLVAPDYVRACVAALEATGAQGVGGPMRPHGTSRMGEAIAAAGTSRFAVPSAFHVSQDGQYTDTVYMGAWPRAVLEGVGGFDERLHVNEDYELNYRIRQAGGRLYLSPTIRSSYYGRQTLGALARQYSTYGRWKARMLTLHPTSLRLRQVVAPSFVAALVAGGALALATQNALARTGWLAIIAAYVVANLAFAWRAAQDDARLLWRVPVVFLTIHLAWGTGWWVGLLPGGWRAQRLTAAKQAEQRTRADDQAAQQAREVLHG